MPRVLVPHERRPTGFERVARRDLGTLPIREPLVRAWGWADMSASFSGRFPSRPALFAAALALAGCSADTIVGGLRDDGVPDPGVCDLDPLFLFDSGVRRDAIPALTSPPTLAGTDPDLNQFLAADDRVVGIVVDDIAYAVPHNILWYHEIVNETFTGPSGALDVAFTYCPLTGSALVFDRAAAGGAEFGVSGLLYKSNLIMYDRTTELSLWPQMLGAASCGPSRGVGLDVLPSIEMTWNGWRTLHPDTRVVIGVGVNGPYDQYPYGDYEDDPEFDFPMPALDRRRGAKERVFGVQDPDGGAIAFPFETLDANGDWAVVPFASGLAQVPAVVFWDGSRRAAAAYLGDVNGDPMTWVADGDGFMDEETGSRWSIEGIAIEGPLAGERLEPIERSFVAFWGAWYSFFPGTAIWGPAKPDIPTPS